MRGRRLLFLALLAVGTGLGLLLAGAPWDTPGDPVRIVTVETATTRPPTTTTTVPEPTTATEADDVDTSTTTSEAAP